MERADMQIETGFVTRKTLLEGIEILVGCEDGVPQCAKSKRGGRGERIPRVQYEDREAISRSCYENARIISYPPRIHGIHGCGGSQGSSPRDEVVLGFYRFTLFLT